MSLKRDIIEKQRAAHIQGATLMLKRLGRSKGGKIGREHIVADAVEAYPIPVMDVPRILRITNTNPSTMSRWPFMDYRIVDGKLEYRLPTVYGTGAGRTPATSTGQDWRPDHNRSVETLQALLNLYENPTETKEIA